MVILNKRIKILFTVVSAIVLAVVLMRTPSQDTTVKPERKILYYKHPMGQNVTSPVPAKDEMGMDFIPVYSDEISSVDESGTPGRAAVPSSKTSRQMIGIVEGEVKREEFIKEIRAGGKVAYDPQLYQAITEYQIASKAGSAASIIQNGGSAHGSLQGAGRMRLKLLGLSDDQIGAVEKGTLSGSNFVVPKGKAWVNVQIFENELQFVKVGQEVAVTAPSAEGQIFSGTVLSVSPIVDPQSRTVLIRSEVSDPSEILKPDMFVSAVIKVNLGEKLTVPDSAVVHTGISDIVYVLSENGKLIPRAVVVGAKSSSLYEVVNGLELGEKIIVSGNFLVDSESRLRAVSRSDEQGTDGK